MEIIFYVIVLVNLMFICHSVSAGSPYAVGKVGTSSGGSQLAAYDYDEGGNRLTNGLSAHERQVFDIGLVGKPESIRLGEGTDKVERIFYGCNGLRYLRVRAGGRHFI